MDNQASFAAEYQKLQHLLAKEVHKSNELSDLVRRQAEDINQMNERIETQEQVYNHLSTLNAQMREQDKLKQ